MDLFHPMQFGKRLWIYPNNIEPPDSDDVFLRLDPGLAFGTGTHPTTALCLHWLDNAEISGSSVVDYGCGSGILAIAAALLGAEKVVAVDNDPQALLATRENALRNGVSEKIETMTPEVFYARGVDLVLANILSGPLIELAPVLAGCLSSGGRIVLSGILEDQAGSVQAAYEAQIIWQTTKIEDGWVRLAGTMNMNNQILQQHANKDRTYHAVIAGEYEKVVNEPRAYPNHLLFQPLDRLLPDSGGSMLDLGCGTGQMLRRHMSRYTKITGVDHSPEMLAIARQSLTEKQLSKTQLIQSDLLGFLGEDKGSYDLVSIVGCLHHLHPDELESVVQHAAMRLAADGKMLLAEPLMQENMEPPEAIRQWNLATLDRLPEYSNIIEEPDEAPIDEARMHEVIKNARLCIVEETRGWELFPRHLPASFIDRIRMRNLHRKYGAGGYVRAMLLELNYD